MQNHLDSSIEGLSKGDKKELNLLHKKLREYEEIHKDEKDENNNIPIKDGKLKSRIAKFILKLINETGHHEKLIQETSYIISSFIMYTFDDELEEAISHAGELELPKEHVHGNIFKLFNKMKKILEGYMIKLPKNLD